VEVHSEITIALRSEASEAAPRCPMAGSCHRMESPRAGAAMACCCGQRVQAGGPGLFAKGAAAGGRVRIASKVVRESEVVLSWVSSAGLACLVSLSASSRFRRSPCWKNQTCSVQRRSPCDPCRSYGVLGCAFTASVFLVRSLRGVTCATWLWNEKNRRLGCRRFSGFGGNATPRFRGELWR